MKRIILVLLAFLLCSSIVIAGDYDTALLHDDNAQIFFGELVEYNNEGDVSYVEVIPTKKIKGDVLLDSVSTYQNVSVMENIELENGNTYLFASQNYDGGTRRIHNIMVFETTSNDTRSLKIKGHGNWEGDPTTRIERMLNNGDYERAEKERIAKVRTQNPVAFEGEKSLRELLGITENNIKSVLIYYNSESYSLEPHKLLSVSDVILTPIINGEGMDMDGIYITVDKTDSPMSYIYFNNEGYADICAPFMSRLPYEQYKIQKKDLKYIISNILTEDVEFEISADTVSYVYGFIIIFFVIVLLGGLLILRRRRGNSND